MANAGAVRRMSQSPAITPALNPFFGLLPQPLWNNAKDFFVYGFRWLPLAAGDTEAQSVTTNADADFLICAINGFVVQTDESTVPAHGFQLISIEDDGSGRAFQNQPQHWNNIIGVGTLPGYLPFPKLIPRASTVTVTLQNLVQTDYNIRLSLIGFKIFGGMG